MSAPSIRQRRRPIQEDADVAPSAAPQEEYQVGHCRPPLATRFGGPRGNRSGRKPGSKTLGAAIAKELAAKVDVTIDGRKRRLSKQEVLATNLVNAAISGKPQAQRLLFGHLVQQAAKAAQSFSAGEADAPAEVGDDQLEALRFLASLMEPGNGEDER